jgi:hypothetical protein
MSNNPLLLCSSVVLRTPLTIALGTPMKPANDDIVDLISIALNCLARSDLDSFKIWTGSLLSMESVAVGQQYVL